jgi:C4-dicarboxylate-specific signal transduction histidine kinase
VKTIQLSERRAMMLTPMFDHSLQLAGFTAFIMDTSGLVEERNPSFKNALAALMVLATIAIAIFVYILRYVEMAVRNYSDEKNMKTVKLQSTITQLETAQKNVIEQEKFASLGSMVAGVSHEINKPLGISITAVTSLSSEVEKLQDSANKEELTERQLKGFINDAFEMTELIERNLLRGADLLDSFKKVAVDQSSGNVRTVKFCEFLHEVVSSMGPNLSKSMHHVTIDCDPELTVKTVPGYWSQIIINLISNSLKHGFEGMEHGVILIQVKQSKTDIQLLFSDNGRGIDRESSAKVFEPFYTTKRDSGGSGLGLHLVYNLVSQGLNGAITLKESAQGCVFDIKVPI